MDTDDIRTRIDNTLTILAALQTNEAHALRRALALSADALKAARVALTESEDELEVLTAPERNSAEENLRLQKELQKAKDRITGLEQDLAMARQDHDVEKQVQSIDRKRLQELEKKVAQYESMLMNDEQAFSRYMDRAIEADAKKGRRPPQR
ncbi:MAG: hypothetical protein U1F36_19990 [Planctomycetota bacterium]